MPRPRDVCRTASMPQLANTFFSLKGHRAFLQNFQDAHFYHYSYRKTENRVMRYQPSSPAKPINPTRQKMLTGNWQDHAPPMPASMRTPTGLQHAGGGSQQPACPAQRTVRWGLYGETLAAQSMPASTRESVPEIQAASGVMPLLRGDFKHKGRYKTHGGPSTSAPMQQKAAGDLSTVLLPGAATEGWFCKLRRGTQSCQQLSRQAGPVKRSQ